jgi:hypothetical protein
MMLTELELAFIRNDAQRAMTDTCTVMRKIYIDDDAGGQKQDWQEIATVPCNIAAFSGRVPSERVIAEQFAGYTLWNLLIPHHIDIQKQDRIIAFGQAYDIVGTLNPSTYEYVTNLVIMEVSP